MVRNFVDRSLAIDAANDCRRRRRRPAAVNATASAQEAMAPKDRRRAAASTSYCSCCALLKVQLPCCIEIDVIDLTMTTISLCKNSQRC
jgi:hypothetical protein